MIIIDQTTKSSDYALGFKFRHLTHGVNMESASKLGNGPLLVYQLGIGTWRIRKIYHINNQDAQANTKDTAYFCNDLSSDK